MPDNGRIPEDLRLAFHEAVAGPFRDWYVGAPEPRITLYGYGWTPSAICFFASSFNDDMPHSIYAALCALAKEFGVETPADRSYDSGAHCLIAICDLCLAKRAGRAAI